jgi:hypothetical protein
LFVFSDAALHRRCVHNHPLAGHALKQHAEAQEQGKPERRRCVVCGERIQDPDDYFGTGLLTGNPSSKAFEFNYLHVHRSHFSDWARAKTFRSAVEELCSSTAWEGPRIDFEPGPKWGPPTSSPLKSSR